MIGVTPAEHSDAKQRVLGCFTWCTAKNTTMKDNDLNEKLFINMQERKSLLDQLRKDCDFLKNNSIMDYSLLLGIEKGMHQV